MQPQAGRPPRGGKVSKCLPFPFGRAKACRRPDAAARSPVQPHIGSLFPHDAAVHDGGGGHIGSAFHRVYGVWDGNRETFSCNPLRRLCGAGNENRETFSCSPLRRLCGAWGMRTARRSRAARSSRCTENRGMLSCSPLHRLCGAWGMREPRDVIVQPVPPAVRCIGAAWTRFYPAALGRCVMASPDSRSRSP